MSFCVEDYVVPGHRQNGLADGGVSGCGGVLVDVQRKVDGGVAAFSVGDDNGVIALHIVSGGVIDDVWQVILIDRHVEYGVGRVSDGQVEGYQRVAVRGVGQREGGGVVALGVGHAVNPGEGVADIVNVGVVGRLVHGEMQDGDAVA